MAKMISFATWNWSWVGPKRHREARGARKADRRDWRRQVNADQGLPRSSKL